MSSPDVTQILQEVSGGDKDAPARLMPLVYDELRRLADHYLRQERPDHTLQPTALVHEAYLKLIDQTRVDSKDAVGECLTTQKRFPEAEPLLVESYNTLNSHLGQRDPRTLEALRRLVSLYRAWNKPEQAAQYRLLS